MGTRIINLQPCEHVLIEAIPKGASPAPYLSLIVVNGNQVFPIQSEPLEGPGPWTWGIGQSGKNIPGKVVSIIYRDLWIDVTEQTN